MKFLCFCLLVLAFASRSTAQEASPTPTPHGEQDVVKITTNLIQVDVTVTDKDGKVVRDLKPNEIEIYQNGKKQEVTNFSFVSSVREIGENGIQPKSKKQPGVAVPPPSPIKAANVRRALALVVDDLNLSWRSVYLTQRELRKFVNEQMQDGDLVAVIRTGAGIGALQQFTNDKRQLLAAIDRIRYNAVGTGNIGSFAPLQGKSEIEGSLPWSTDAKVRADDQFRASVYATGTLGALNYVVRGMADLPGRKSIMLISDGFALYTQDPDGNRDSDRVYEAVKMLADHANRASVVIYTVDARGLITTGLSAQDDVGTRTMAEQRQVESDRISDVLTSQQGLKTLAGETGGRSILNNNDLSDGIRKILDDQSYYLVGYAPDDETFASGSLKFNSLSVKVTRPGVTVRYRNGFFGVAEQKPALTGANKTVNRLENALTSPFAVNEIPLRLNALFGSDNRQGSYIRTLLHARLQDLTYTDQPNGDKKVTFDLVEVAFGDNGNAVDHLSKTITGIVKKEDFEATSSTGFVYDFIFPIKKPGAYQLRVALRDHGSDKVGSANQFIEVPDLKKKRLTLSSVALENIPLAVWQQRTAGAKKDSDDRGNALTDTAIRQFKRGSVRNYATSIFNAGIKGGTPALTSQIKLFLNGQEAFNGKVLPITDPQKFSGSLNLGTEMASGDYVMEIIVTDKTESEKPRTAVQFVQFEIVD